MKINVSYPSHITRPSKEMLENAASLMRAGQATKAIPILESLLEKTPKDLPEEEIQSKLGVAYMMTGRAAQAIKTLNSAIKTNPHFIPAHHNLCLTYTQIGDLDQAIACGTHALETNPEAVELSVALSNAYRRAGNPDKALEMMEKAAQLRPNDTQIISNYGSWLFEAGRRDEAHDCFSKTIEIAPDHTPSHRMLSLTHTYQKGDPYFENLLALAERDDLALAQEAELHFSLGRAYEDIEDYKKSFNHYIIGNDKKRKTHHYAIENERAFMAQFKETFTDDSLVGHNQNERPTPIFIVGMPRSGTSLVEQILASHTQIHGAGELHDLDHIQFQIFEINPADYSSDWARLSTQDFNNMAGLYLQKLSKLSKGKPYVTDKMPLNFRNIGMIAQLFPDAKIIHCRRDPRATCFSIYKALFGGHLPFANNQKELAEYFKLYEDLMAHWNRVLPGRIYDVCYEDLVIDPSEHIAALLKHCELEWQDTCMDPHKTKRAVTTASALQVREPIYQKAIAYWKNFEPYMDSEILNLKS